MIGQTELKLTKLENLTRPEIEDIKTRVRKLEVQELPFLKLATVTTKGDLLVASAAATIMRLGVGANDTMLIADSAQAAGMRWGTPTIFALLAGQAGGQTLNGGTASGNNLTFVSTSNATKGKILFGTSGYDEVNNRLGVGTTSPGYALDVTNRARFRSGAGGTAGVWLSDSTPTDRTFFGLLDDTASPVAGYYHNGAWRFVIDANGNTGIGITTPDTTLHAHKASAGTVSAIANTVLTVENSTDNIIQMLCPNASLNSIFFGNVATNDDMRITHDRANGNLIFYITGSGRVRLNATNNSWEPVSDNGQGLGRSGQRWSAVWSSNGTIQTSDVREKKALKASPLGLNFINRLEPVSWKWNDTKLDTKEHHGLSAQQVKEAADAEGAEFGGYVYDAETDAHALAYAEFFAPVIKALQEISTRLDKLEAKSA